LNWSSVVVLIVPKPYRFDFVTAMLSVLLVVLDTRYLAVLVP